MSDDLEQFLYHPASRIPVRNAGETDIPAYGIVRITGSETSERSTRLTVDQPDSTYRQTYLVNGHREIKAGRTGVAYLATHSPVWALWDSSATTPSLTGPYFGPMQNSYKLNSSGYGFRVVGASETTPFRRVLVMQQPPGNIYGRLDADLAFEGTAAVDVRYFVSESSTTTTNTTVTAYDGLLKTGFKLASGSDVILTWIAGKWVVTHCRACPVAA